MDVIRGIMAELLQIESIEQTELLEKDRSLRPRAALVDIQAVIVDGHRHVDLRLPCGEVLQSEQAAVFFAAGVTNSMAAHEFDHALSRLTFVPVVDGGLDSALPTAGFLTTLYLDNFLHGGGPIGILEHLADPRYAGVRAVHAGRAWPILA